MDFLKRMKSMLKRAIGKVRRTFAHLTETRYASETSKCRSRLAKYCSGSGVDLGFGGDAINAEAVRVDFARPYANTGDQPVQLAGDCRFLVWFRDGVLDYVYSSHLLEDFEDTRSILKEWLRVLKPGGQLVLFCPDEQVYRRHCAATGQIYNVNHKHADFSLQKVKQILADLAQTTIVHENSLVDEYSWELVVRKS